MKSTPDLVGWVRSDQVQNLTLGSGGQSKGKGKVCCHGTLGDWVETWTVCYPYGYIAKEMFLTPPTSGLTVAGNYPNNSN